MKELIKVEILGNVLKLYTKNGERYFSASEVGGMLKYSKSNISKLVAQVEDDEKIKCSVKVSFQNRNSANGVRKTQEKWFLTKDGLYELLFLGKNEKCKEFKKEVKRMLKEIEKNGYYIATDKDNLWIGTRSDSKEVRKSETDTIKEFVEYAKKQGSSKPNWYYKHFTNLVRKKLEIPKELKRDEMSQKVLLQIQSLETLISMKLETLLLKDKGYKEIYEIVKELILNI